MGWSFNSAELRQVVSGSSFLTDLTVALGAQIGDHDLQLLTTSCPHLEHLTLAFQHVSDAGQLPQLALPAARFNACQEDCHTHTVSSQQPLHEGWQLRHHERSVQRWRVTCFVALQACVR